jgi:predicted nuclease of restriction endonuclease-like (RecB) superfamily
MKKPLKKLIPPKSKTHIEGFDTDYANAMSEIISLLETARHASSRSVNTIMTTTYWEIGRRIMKYEKLNPDKAGYGEKLITNLADDLTRRFGRGFGRTNLFQMRAFFLAYPEIVQTASEPLRATSKQGTVVQTASELSSSLTLTSKFPLPWSHYVRLISIQNPNARRFYETEALRGGWTVRQLNRQIETQFYERTALSKNKAAMLTRGKKQLPEDTVTPEEEIKDPFVLEFLGLKDEYSENNFEEALVHQLESFLLELGEDFAFVGRQRRLRIGDEWYRVDLLFFHRRLRCLVVIDLKLGKFTHADAGQMHLYLNYARKHWTYSGENPPVGLILCTQKDASVARYALEGLPNKILAAEYRMTLPDEKILVEELERTRKILENRIPPSSIKRKVK